MSECDTAASLRTEFRLTGLDCPDCARGVAASVQALDGVVCASLSFATGVLIVEHDDPSTPGLVASLVTSMDYGVVPIGGSGASEIPGPSLRARLTEPAVWFAGGLLLTAWFAGLAGAPEGLTVVASLIAIILCGGPVLRRAIVALRARVLDMNALMAVAVVGALALGEYREAAMVVFLFAVGGALESRALSRTRRSIRDLVSLTPLTAFVIREGRVDEVEAALLRSGDVVLVKPGERIPADGEVVSGSSAVDQAAITGESIPVHKQAGDRVWAGTLNGNATLDVCVTSAQQDTTLAQIVRLVEDAQATQAPIQGLVDRFSRWYTPAVVALAAFLATVPPAALWISSGVFEPREWVYRALVLLVVSCPCALVISTPVAVVSAITRAARDGVLVKGGAFVEAAAGIKVVAFDKTGTLTLGAPALLSVIPAADWSEQAVLEIAAALESRSAHPLARAVLDAVRGQALETPVDVIENPGRGVAATLSSGRYLVGNLALARESGIQVDSRRADVERLESRGQTVILVAQLGVGRVIGVLGVADELRPDAALAVSELRAAGVRHLVMLTGDNERVGSAIAAGAGVDECLWGLLPQDKAEAVVATRTRYGPVAMIGDGINDAPALATADIGIAMGAASSDTALETADVALMTNDLSALPRFLALGKRTLTIIRQNVWFSVVVKFAVLGLALGGTASLWLAVFADTGVALLVILNGLRLLRAPKRGIEKA